ncbi:MAG: 5'-3' exonuclease H3TH domain-containing protein [Kiritimatiellae bacterium]|jgi:DNA polymerase-1|nr:5'-3' exonuclease H3TH domain-containing protein [Kiritimatiellia bacterium]MDY0150236.1 5'-3' exonuclease H3TH domain-containing protein [Kiritimatiellia bacterium]
MMKSVLIVDGTAVAYRAFYAVRGLSTRDGTPTNALFGFIRMIRQLEAQWGPDRLVVTFDGGSPAHRLAKCPDYKAQRSPMPDELRTQLPLINEFLDTAGIPMILIDAQEADDVMATLAVRATTAGTLVRLATSDKDLMQLVSERVRIVPPTKTDTELDPAGVEAKTGVRPSQIVDWLALIGDVADNIPGVMGIGPKTATKLLVQYGSLEAALAQIEQITPPGLRDKMRSGSETARLNVELMTLDGAVPDVPEWKDIPPPAPDLAGLKAFYEKYELHRFVTELNRQPSAAPRAAPPPPPPTQQLELF